MEKNIYMKTVQKLINILPPDSKVLDVGALGLMGENTTQFLVDKFGAKNVTGVCLNPEQPEWFLKKYPDFKFILDDAFAYSFKEKFDLVVTDLGIEKNIEEWSEEGLEKIKSLIKPRGYLLNYVMATTQYGDPLYTPFLIRKHWMSWWRHIYPHEEGINEAIGNKLKELEDWELILAEREERRPYILWILLKLK